ncbi:MAG: CDP-alcohol phosphatidyltransferase family protein, partial [Pseudomonadota bacterium]
MKPGSTGRVAKSASLREELVALPNLLTFARIALLPVILVLIDNYSRFQSFLAAMLFAAGAATDVLDGMLARR